LFAILFYEIGEKLCFSFLKIQTRVIMSFANSIKNVAHTMPHQHSVWKIDGGDEI
jgi:hypothetical protein